MSLMMLILIGLMGGTSFKAYTLYERDREFGFAMGFGIVGSLAGSVLANDYGLSREMTHFVSPWLCSVLISNLYATFFSEVL